MFLCDWFGMSPCYLSYFLSLQDDNKLSPSGCVPIGVDSTDLALLPLAGAGDEHS